jgi:hypothetical protein
MFDMLGDDHVQLAGRAIHITDAALSLWLLRVFPGIVSLNHVDDTFEYVGYNSNFSHLEEFSK